MPTTEGADDDGSVLGGGHQSDLPGVQVFIMLCLADTLTERIICTIILTLAVLEDHLKGKKMCEYYWSLLPGRLI